ncbi:hypothetical protein RW110999_028 [Cyanophage S-RIM4]|nr:hypothetical protein RW110999_028 [Cyanophage S-RIM4]
MSILEMDVDNILGFTPASDEYQCFMIDLTPKQAQHILDYYNRDNRKISKSQVNKIYRSIEADNWLLDGQPMTFNKEGNLTEFQHRLCAIAKCPKDRVFKVVVVLGVDVGCFTKTATNKQRKPIDEIQRKHPLAHTDQVSILGDILKRRRQKRLCMQNAIASYRNWVGSIDHALEISGNFENVFDKFSLQRKTIRAYLALCDRYGYLDECLTLMEFLDSELEEETNSVSTLTTQFLEFWNDHAVDLSNEGRMDTLYAMLCVATDRIIMREDGMIEFGARLKQLEHVEMEKQGIYRKFLA